MSLLLATGSTATATVYEQHDQPAVVGAVSSIGNASIREQSDIASLLAKISSNATAAILESHDAISAAAQEIASGIAAILEQHDKVVVHIPALGFAAIVERADRISGAGIVSSIGHVSIREFPSDMVAGAETVSSILFGNIVERAEDVGHTTTGALVSVVAFGTLRSSPPNTTLTIPVDTSAGGTISQIVITLNSPSNHADAVRTALGEIERALNLHTLANSTFS